MHDVTITSCYITPSVLSNPDQDELEVYGSESQSSGPSTLASYKFEVCDSLLNIGPIKDMALGMPAFLSVSRSEFNLERKCRDYSLEVYCGCLHIAKVQIVILE